VSPALLLEAVDEELESESGGADVAACDEGVVEEERSTLAGRHVLVVSARDDEPAQLGIPIDRVIGLVDGPRCPRGVGRLVVERRPVEGRVVSVLDPCRLVERAIEVIEQVA
jgi:hypothetical protein